MAEIILSNGKIALVNDEDFIRLNKYRWHQHGKGYAHAHINKKAVYMHRLILHLFDSKIHTDHINHNELDNRKENIRVATRSQNMSNQLKRKGKTSSKYKGVSWNKEKKKWTVNCKAQFISYFTNEIEAAKIYDEAAKRLFGEFACLNFR